MQNNTIEELIQLKQNGKIGWCELALHSDHGNNNAELYLEETESRIYDDGNEFADAFAEAIV